jgi:hypothetical protein
VLIINYAEVVCLCKAIFNNARIAAFVSGALACKILQGMSKVLFLSNDVLGDRMAGPAIRALELARVLAQRHTVVVAMSDVKKSDLTSYPVEIIKANRAQIRRLLNSMDVVIVQGYSLRDHPEVAKSDAAIVVDLYDPFPFENLELYATAPLEVRRGLAEADLAVLTQQLLRGDLFLAASEKQRDLWLGALLASGRITPEFRDAIAAGNKVIELVPFGLPEQTPRSEENLLEKYIPDYRADDFIIVWGGGLYNWFNPLPFIEATWRLWSEGKRARLFFMGVKHPNERIPAMEVVESAVQFAKSIGAYAKSAIFNFDWIPYEKRQDVLLHASAGVSFHKMHLESEYAFRTRILDYFWCGLPTLCAAGDELSRIVEQNKCGVTFATEDPSIIAGEIERLMMSSDLQREMRENALNVAKMFSWGNVARPLLDYCDSPRRLRTGKPLPRRTKLGPVTRNRMRMYRARAVLKQGGISALLREIRVRLFH